MAQLDRKITHNKHGMPRVCNRCHNTQVPTVVKVKSEHLCEECKQKRIARQRQNRTFVHNKCRCGQTISQHADECDACFNKTLIEVELDGCHTVEELKEFIRNNLLPGG